MTALELLNSPDRWCQVSEVECCYNLTALDCRGKGVVGHDKRACRWTLLGAIQKCYQGLSYLKALVKLKQHLGKDIDPSKWNNDPGRQFSEVQQLLNEVRL